MGDCPLRFLAVVDGVLPLASKQAVSIRICTLSQLRGETVRAKRSVPEDRPSAIAITIAPPIRFLFWEDRALLFYSIPYAFVHEFGLFWLYFIALCKLKTKGWRTR